jgi:glycosyltransferase involved in cell wall biosynthesis
MRASSDLQVRTEEQEPERRHNVVQQSATHGEPTERRLADQRLRIAMLAPPWIPVPPPGYGGIEYVVALLCDALVDSGHDVELFCAPGSHSRAKARTLLPSPHPESIGMTVFEADHVARALDLIDEAAARGKAFDLIHDHTGCVVVAFADRLSLPVVHTVHGPFDDVMSEFYEVHGRKARLVCISRSQASFAPAGANVTAVVYNPIDVDAWPVGFNKQDYLLWLGRFVPEKGPQRAIRVAKATKRRLILAGTVQPRYERFFADEIQPHIDGQTITFVGEVGGARKQRLFADAFAFLMPISWPEPFGMVIVESLAAGTPVIAFAHGAAPEIIEDAKTGFLVRDEEEMVALVDKAGALDPRDCRRGAERFSPARIAAGYEETYLDAVARGTAPTLQGR